MRTGYEIREGAAMLAERRTMSRPRPPLRQYVVYLSDDRGNLYSSVGLAQGRAPFNARDAIASRFWGDSRITNMTKMPAAARNTFRVEFAGSGPGYYRAVLQ
jgi:hypothetical protein